MSRLIDADELRKNVLKWMPSDPCGKEEKEFPFETDICASMVMEIDDAPTVQPERKTGHWILDRSGAYCCSKCMEPCATYAMMKPRDKYCKMCGAKMEGGEHK